MRLPIYQVDAFTDRVFGGNPAAVVLLEESLTAETMQAVAAENNLSETAFVIRQEEGFGLRWFTPKLEVDLCGHATLASAFVLFENGMASEEVRFNTASGGLTVRSSGDLISMDFPVLPAETVPAPAGLSEALGLEPVEVLSARDLMAVFETERDVISLVPDFTRLGMLEAFAVIVTAPGEGEVDFVSRFFAPKAGILEDPVTGSAHCTLTPFWSERLGKTVLRARQVSRRGGELLCENRGERVGISGRAVQFLSGEISI